MYYQIRENLVTTTLENCLKDKVPYVAILTPEEWADLRERFEMGIDLDMELEAETTKAEVNFDSITGSFSIPDRTNISGARSEFSYALDEKGIVFIDRGHKAEEMAERIRKTKKWRLPSLERFIFDFMELIVKEDRVLLGKYESRLEKIEDRVLEQDMDAVLEEINDIRGDLLDIRTHYEQLMDVGQELEENENNFFAEENLRYFHLFTVRVERLNAQVLSLRDYTMQIRDLYQSQLDVKQNRIMSVLTIITTIFFPLSIITGWYGMNFVHMPELEYAWAYPAVACVCVTIVASGLLFFRRKKLL